MSQMLGGTQLSGMKNIEDVAVNYSKRYDPYLFCSGIPALSFSCIVIADRCYS